jgi:peptidase S41-like protein
MFGLSGGLWRLIFVYSLMAYPVLADGVDLLQRYPTTLADVAATKDYAWNFSKDDIFELSEFNLIVTDSLEIKLGSADVGIGSSENGAVWAAVIPRATGTILSEAAPMSEKVAHVWLRFHPTDVIKLFPPNTVKDTGDEKTYNRMRQICDLRFRSSYHQGNNALIPEVGVYGVDVDVTEGERRFFSVDLNKETVKHYPKFIKAISINRISKNDAELSFDLIWDAFDRDYAMFVIRPEVDWDALKVKYRTLAIECKTAYDFAGVCAKMLAHLRDLHVWVRIGHDSIPVFDRPRKLNANPRAIPSIIGELKTEKSVQWAVTKDKIGYIAINSWSDQKAPKSFEKAIATMTNTRGLIVDVRMNGGGSETLARPVAGRFLVEEATYAYSQYRSDKTKRTELGEKIARCVRPAGPWHYDRPVVLLIGQKCLSSNEAFAAMMDQAPRVTLMGDHTGGSSGNPKMIETPIDVRVSVPRWLSILVDGKLLDERGVQPDVVFEETTDSFTNGDALLEAALERLRKVDLPAEPIHVPVVLEQPLEEMAQQQSSSGMAQTPDQHPPSYMYLDPLFGNDEVEPDYEIMISFDQLMKPDCVQLQFTKGGVRAVKNIEYDEETYGFTMPVQFEPECEHELTIPANGFQTMKGAGSSKMSWTFKTTSFEPDEEAPTPKLIAVDPPEGSTISRITRLRLQFDSPMAPHSVYLQYTGGDKKEKAQLCPAVQYESESNTLILPVIFPAEWDGEILLSGLQSRAGKPADAVKLKFKTNDQMFAETHLQEFEESEKDKELLSLLASMKKARMEIKSLDETVQRIALGGLRKFGFTELRVQSASYKVQGASQFRADISDYMSSPFFIGSTGRRYWQYSNESGKKSLLGCFPDEVNEVALSVFDPFGLTTKDIETVMKDNNLQYLGTENLIDRDVHIIRAWRVVQRNGLDLLCLDRWFIDPESFLPLRVQRTASDGSCLMYVFQINHTNEEYTITDFAPAKVTRMPMTFEEELGEGFDKRFIHIMDGSDGDFRVEWGKSGVDKYQSVGLN